MAENNEFIREVDDEYRRDRIAQFWNRYNGVVIGLAVLLVAAVGGWRYWQSVERGRAEAAGSRYEEAIRAAREGKSEDAEQTLAAIANEAPDGYQLLAKFRLAAERGKQDAEDGAKAYDALAADASVSPTLQDLARLRGAMLRMSTGTADAATFRPALERLAQPSNPWRHTARELLGLAAFRSGDFEAAGRWFDQISADRETPQGLRSRMEIYAAIVAAGPVQTTQ